MKADGVGAKATTAGAGMAGGMIGAKLGAVVGLISALAIGATDPAEFFVASVAGLLAGRAIGKSAGRDLVTNRLNQ
jgi:hypothetical protein